MRCFVAILALSLQAQTGRIQVSAIDLAAAPIHANIVVSSPESDELFASGQASQDRGIYLSPPLPPGRYRIRIKLGGFRTEILDGVMVESGRTTEVPPVTMKFQGCDSPGTICDSFGLEPPQKGEAWEERLRAGCPIDLDRKSKKKCASKAAADLLVELRDKKLYFVAANGARFSDVNPESQNCRIVPYTTDRIRVDNLGSGFDLCLKTKRGKVVAIFFQLETPRGANSVPVRLVARP